MKDLLSLAGRPYRWRLLTALRTGQLPQLQSRYREGSKRLRAYADAGRGPVVEFLTFRETAYGVSLEHVQMVFASSWIRKCAPTMIHDIGSHRAWVLGLGQAIRSQASMFANLQSGSTMKYSRSAAPKLCRGLTARSKC